jgi:hypothetical protein
MAIQYMNVEIHSIRRNNVLAINIVTQNVASMGHLLVVLTGVIGVHVMVVFASQEPALMVH